LTHFSAAKRRFFWIQRRLTLRKWVSYGFTRGSLNEFIRGKI
jgi:hypothetical protein